MSRTSDLWCATSLVVLSLKLLADIRVARDRLNRTPQNSSMPSGSQPPWASGTKKDADPGADEEDADEEEMLNNALRKNAKEHSTNTEGDGDSGGAGEPSSDKSDQNSPAVLKVATRNASLANSLEHRGVVARLNCL